MPLNRPTASELVEACNEFYSDLLLNNQEQAQSSHNKFHALVARNVLNIVQRELNLLEVYQHAELESVSALQGEVFHCVETANRALIKKIESGVFDGESESHELLAALKPLALLKLSVDNPNYSSYKRLSQ